MTRTRVLTVASLVGLLAIVASGCLAVGQPSQFLGGARAYDVNDHGLAVGSRWLIGPPISLDDHAYSYDLTTGVTTDLGTLGGVGSAALAVNEDGAIVGWSRVASAQLRAFVYRSTTGMVDLGTLAPVATTPSSTATGINSAGTIVGWSSVEGGAVDPTRAFVYDPTTSTMTDLGTLGGTSSAATAINDAGVIVGWSEIAGDVARHAFVYDPTTAQMLDLGTFGGTSSEATDLNEHGQVVGWSELPGEADPYCGSTCPPTRGFVHELTTGTTTELPMPPGFDRATPSGINEDGVVVGSAADVTIVCSHCSFPSKGMAWELGTTGVYAVGGNAYRPTAINDAGVAVGTGTDFSTPFAPIPFAFRVDVVPVS